MTTPAFRGLKAIAQRLVVLLVSVVMLLSLAQTAVLASTSSIETKPGSAPGITEPIPGENLSELKEQRREWQERASSSHDVKNNKGDSLGETLKEKLNLEEIKEGYEPQKESEKRSSSTR
jgi:hypothetical protein